MEPVCIRVQFNDINYLLACYKRIKGKAQVCSLCNCMIVVQFNWKW